MKAIIPLLALVVFFTTACAYARDVKDPLLDFYATAANSGDNIYQFKAKLSANGQDAYFFTADGLSLGPHGDYGWFMYYPVASGGYRFVEQNFGFHRSGPAYVGYVSEFKRYAVVDTGKHVVSVQYLDNGRVEIKFLGKNEEAEPEDYPKYFQSSQRPKVRIYSPDELKKKYPKTVPHNITDEQLE